MTYFHGTTDKFLRSIQRKGLLPASCTGNICENRSKGRTFVFVTDNEQHAKGYALRASIRHGGKPILLAVRPYMPVRDGKNQFICSSAEIVYWTDIDSAATIDEMVACFA